MYAVFCTLCHFYVIQFCGPEDTKQWDIKGTEAVEEKKSKKKKLYNKGVYLEHPGPKYDKNLVQPDIVIWLWL